MGLLSRVYLLVLVSGLVLAEESPLPERAAAAELSNEVSSGDVDQSYFLPRNTIPSHYFIHLTTNIHANVRTFRATTEIYFRVVQPTSTVTMHLQELDIQLVELYRLPDSLGPPVLVARPVYKVDTRIEHVVFSTLSELPIGSYYLKVTYTGSMRNYQSGYLVSSYQDDNGVENFVGSTHFQATLARRVFPCYDEPDLKATITLWITHHRSYSAIANMPLDSGNVDPDNSEYVISKFRRTPKMSTYLLAFAVTNFVVSRNGRHNLWVRSNVAADGALALEASPRILDAMAQHTGVQYFDYMPHLNQIAVPDRGTGAMENWGLVTYGEPSLLFNPAVNGYRNRKRVTTVIAHELAHQWFGNLVSPQWWDYIWLSEGFATLYEYYASTLAYPELDYWALFNVEVVQRAFAQDATENIRPMNHPAASQDEVWRLFDIIAYQKSGSVLNMLRQVLGDENWQAGLNIYLQNRKLNSAKPSDLYAGLQTASKGKNAIPESFTLDQFMESWTNAAGFPVVNVRRNYKTGEAVISQERYLASGRLPGDHVWYIPYNYLNPQAQSQLHWLTSKAAKIAVDTDPDQWVIFNRDQFGYYRVNYDARNWEMIIDTLLTNPTAIPRANRAQLIDDAFNLARSDRLDMAIALKLLAYLKHETEYAPWAAANNALNYFYSKLRGTPHYAGFVSFVGELVSEVYKTLQVAAVYPGESTAQKYLKQTVTNWACRIGAADCLDKAYEALKQEVDGGSTVHPDVAAVVYCHGLRDGSNSMLTSYLIPKMQASKNQAQRTDLITAMGCTKDPVSVRTLLTILELPSARFLSTERVQIVDAIVAGGREEVDALIDYLTNYTNGLLSVLGEGAFNGVIMNIAGQTNSVEERQQLDTLLTSLEATVAKETLDAARAQVKRNADWFDSLEGLVSIQFYEKYANSVV